MSSDSSPAEIPPMPSLETAAAGASADGAHWEIRAGGSRENYLTLLDITLPDGRMMGGGGHGGPVLPPGRRISFSAHRRSDPDIHYLVGRVHPSVKRLHLTLTGPHQEGLDVHPVGESKELGVAFVAEILPTAAELVNVEALDGAGSRIEDRSATHYSMLLGEDGPSHAARADSNDRHISWTPPDRR